ncbi:MAG: hypothetical protein ACRDTT_05560 [Pseudonocardiaceae bacterium]
MPTRRSRFVHDTAERLRTIPITCCVDGQAHDVTDENVAAGRTGEYLALCGYRVVAAPLVAPVGRPCAKCTAVLVAAHQPQPSRPVRRVRHRQRGWLWRMLHPHSDAAVANGRRHS